MNLPNINDGRCTSLPLLSLPNVDSPGCVPGPTNDVIVHAPIVVSSDIGILDETDPTVHILNEGGGKIVGETTPIP